MVGRRIRRGLLGRHVGRRPDRRPDLGERAAGCHRARRAQRLRDPEVGHHRRSAGEQHVVGLDVAMDDSALVRVRKRLRHVAQHADHLGHRQGAAGGQSPAQRLAVHERHRVVRHAAHLPGREHGHDVWMLQPGGELDLPVEPLGVHPGEQIRRQHLHDDISPQCLLTRQEHPRHAAAAKLARDRVRRAERVLELFAEGHGRGGGQRRTKVGPVPARD